MNARNAARRVAAAGLMTAAPRAAAGAAVATLAHAPLAAASRARWGPRAAEIGALALVLGAAIALRLVGIANDTDISDEGIRGVQLRLMAAGFKPVSEIYASQGPLSLWLFYPVYALFGGDLVAARLASVVYGVVCLLATALLGRALAGPLAGVAAAFLLGVGPIFLENSRLAFVEVPSLAPALLGLVVLLRWRQTGRHGWLVVAASLLAVGALAKPMAAVVGVAALALVLAGPTTEAEPTAGTGTVQRADRGRRFRVRCFRVRRFRLMRARLLDLLVFALAGLTLAATVVLAIGPLAIWEQLVGYRVAARAARGWELAANLGLLRAELAREGWGLPALALVGALLSLGRDRALTLALIGWPVAALLMLLAHAPLWPKHLVYLVPPLAILGGAAVAEAARLAVVPVTRRSPEAGRSFLRVAALGALLAYVVAVPLVVVAEDRTLLSRAPDGDAARYADDLRIVAAATGTDDFVVVDDAYLAATVGRLTPPFLADLSWNRILARALTAEQAIAETRRFDTRVVVVQDDHLGRLDRYLTWLDREYVLVKSYTQRKPTRFRRVYVRPDVDLGPAREALLAGLDTRLDAQLGPVALRGFSLDHRDWKSGSRYGLALFWEVAEVSPAEHVLRTRLRADDGTAALDNEWRIGEAGQELHTWAPGRWQSQALRILADDVRPGRYTLTVAVERAGRAGVGVVPVEVSLGNIVVTAGARGGG